MHRQNSNERFQGMVEQYRAARLPWPATMQQVAEWAVRCNLYAPRPNAVIRELAERLSEALKVEYFVDPQGRSVRVKHAARIKQDDGTQPTLWDDIRTAPRDHMEI